LLTIQGHAMSDNLDLISRDNYTLTSKHHLPHKTRTLSVWTEKTTAVMMP